MATPKREEYFVEDDVLYYVVEVMEQHYLIENCQTLDIMWFSIDSLANVSIVSREEVITC